MDKNGYWKLKASSYRLQASSHISAITELEACSLKPEAKRQEYVK